MGNGEPRAVEADARGRCERVLALARDSWQACADMCKDMHKGTCIDVFGSSGASEHHTDFAR